MRNFIKAGFVVLVAGAMTISACSDKSGNSNVMTGTGGKGAGGTTGAGGADAGTDGPDQTGAGGTAGAGGAGGGSANAHQDHLNLINKATTGGIMVTRPAPVAYDSCKI